ncbi:magnesium-translocating P-type ATPase [Parachlamydia acanthamoebae]|uniref:Magnesium-transporting ATPase, P-type 1 n=1 Tax=Parachlamydia acanthamoebae TaxID=83552 RepID=A0A0C1E7R3_9BACT|nr:magnesium-translocating P-type ATPase [Parachlamydia acanthamoebae]KIA77257.1 Magnesium-transporting ATPase, P-type 1 [Parachlamydia acanthamoebae]
MLDTSQSFWSLSIQEILKGIETNLENGLSDAEAKKRLRIYGDNVLKVKKSKGTLQLLFAQFNTPLIYMLLFAAGLSLLLYDRTDALIIFGIIAISTLLSFYQERSAVKAMEQLLKIVQIKAAVIRSAQKKEIPIEEVVPGDIVELHAGDIIPADSYVLEAKDLYVDEATLTGETFYAEKFAKVTPQSAPISKRTNILFMGTHVISGTAKVAVIVTGKNTEFGKISERLSLIPPETEFEHGVRRFGYFLMEVTFVLLIIIFAFNVYLARPLVESLLFALSLSVGLTPQLLPAIITINLAHGAIRMAKSNVIVKKLVSIENFGSMDILCADKTGTLTTGEVKLNKACDFKGVENSKVALYAYLNAFFQTGYTNPIDQALMHGTSQDIHAWKKLDEVPYDFIRKRISILAENENSRFIVTKGAFQQILSICTHVETSPDAIEEIRAWTNDLKKQYITYSKSGFRVLGLAYRKENDISILTAECESQMIFLGFLLFWDPIKEDIATSVDNLKKLGISLKIITGDNRLVALHVAKLLNIPEEKVLTGPQLHQMSDQALLNQVNRKSIFAEIEPNQKERIILALRKTGHVVGFLGDGINDVTALHAADVSISVDSAADAAKEVADIVLMEKNLSVLEEGVKAGRMTFSNTLKYVFMASSANFGNMFSMAGASLFLSFLPLLPKQVLLTNLMTDFPEITIASDNVDKEMIEKPLRWNIGFIRKFMIIFGLISSIFDYATFGVLLWLKASVEEFRTAWFIESVVSATLVVLVIRTFKPFFASLPGKYLLIAVTSVAIMTLFLPIMPFANYLGFTELSMKFYLFITLIVALYIATVEFAKKNFYEKA